MGMIETTYGAQSAPPDNWREVTEEEFATRALVRAFAPVKMDYRQFTWNGEFFGVQLWVMHDGTGHCFHVDYMHKRVRLFLFGCEHTYVEASRPPGNRSGIHTEKCSKCDHVNSYDTSD